MQPPIARLSEKLQATPYIHIAEKAPECMTFNHERPGGFVEEQAVAIIKRNLKIHQRQGRTLERKMRQQRKQLRVSIQNYFPSFK